MDEFGEAEASVSANLAVKKIHMKGKAEAEAEGQGRSMAVDDNADAFNCAICQELLYKPVVQACGHVFCFWCIHKAMSGVGLSHCPLCRSPYKHFPRVCELLHYLLLKAFPEDYRQRSEEVLEWEKQEGIFSPQLGDPQTVNIMDASKVNRSAIFRSFSRGDSPQNDSLPESTVTSKCTNIISLCEKINEETKSIHTSSLYHQSISPSDDTSVGMYNDIRDSVASNKLNGQENVENPILQNKVTVDDALCCHCKELIYHPRVLSCGHSFCESCINIYEDKTLKCQVCQSSQPGGLPGVCLELHQFLEHIFPVEYAERKKSVLVHKKMWQQPNEKSTCIKEAASTTSETPEQQAASIHRFVGCDCCGIYPIMGTRYKCLDCPESIGFDLCETCYKTGASLPGRFNQQHKVEHCFHRIARVIPANIEHIEALVLFNITESSENSERNQDESHEEDYTGTLGML